MSDWYLVLAPLAVLVIVLLFGFVGCQSFGSSPEMTAKTVDKPGPTPGTTVPDYPATIKAEASLVAYWRLGEPATTAIAPPPPGGIAKEEQGAHPGRYFKFVPPLNPDSKRHSFGNTGVLKLEQKPGLLEHDPNEACILVNGGFVNVDFDAVLHPPKFTYEAWINPQFDTDPLGNYYCLFEAGAPTTGQKKEGFGLYAGPANPGSLNTPYEWQVWMGNGTTFAKVNNTLPAPSTVVFNKVTYLALTYDGVAVVLYLYYPNTNQDMTLASVAPLQAKFSGYKPAKSGTLVIGAGRNLFPAVPGASPPVLYAFHGRIQEVAIYNQALTIQAHLAGHEQAGGSF